jgi:hypothetical protein
LTNRVAGYFSGGAFNRAAFDAASVARYICAALAARAHSSGVKLCPDGGGVSGVGSGDNGCGLAGRARGLVLSSSINRRASRNTRSARLSGDDAPDGVEGAGGDSSGFASMGDPPGLTVAESSISEDIAS